MLEDLLAADAGYEGPAVDCGTGHQAEFVSYRAKTMDTVWARSPCAGPTTTAASAGRCRAPGRELGVRRASMSPGLRKMAARAAAAVPFAKAAGLLAELAGIA